MSPWGCSWVCCAAVINLPRSRLCPCETPEPYTNGSALSPAMLHTLDRDCRQALSTALINASILQLILCCDSFSCAIARSCEDCTKVSRLEHGRRPAQPAGGVRHLAPPVPDRVRWPPAGWRRAAGGLHQGARVRACHGAGHAADSGLRPAYLCQQRHLPWRCPGRRCSGVVAAEVPFSATLLSELR